MRRYIEHMQQTREPHERRAHAMRVAGGMTLALFALWVGTLSLRFTQSGTVETAQDDSNSTSLTASAGQAVQAQDKSGAYLEVSTTSVLRN